jgi:DNA-binding NarL/FixJ family response regulator
MATYPAIAVVILSLHSEEAYVQKALAAGVRGYVLKSRAGQDLVEAIQAVHRGDTFFSQEVLER